MKNKKAVELTLNVIVVAAIVLVVLVVSIMIYTGIIGKESGKVGDIIEGMEGDCDGDGINNILDTCPCDYDDPAKPRENDCMLSAECDKIIKEERCGEEIRKNAGGRWFHASKK